MRLPECSLLFCKHGIHSAEIDGLFSHFEDGAVLRTTPTICTPGPEGHVDDPLSTFLPTLGSSLHPEGPIAQAWGHPGHHIQAPGRPKNLPVGHPPEHGVRATTRFTPPQDRPRVKEKARRKRWFKGRPSKAISRTLAVQELWGVGVGRKEDAFC